MKFIKKRGETKFCPVKRDYASLFLIAERPKREASNLIIGQTPIIIFDIKPFPIHNKYEGYLFNQAIASIFKIALYTRGEVAIFFFDDLEAMEIGLDIYLEWMDGDDELIMVLIG